jgi:hypothetical protein
VAAVAGGLVAVAVVGDARRRRRLGVATIDLEVDLAGASLDIAL